MLLYSFHRQESMKSRFKWDFFVLILLFLFIPSAKVEAQLDKGGSIKGIVTDAESGEALKNVNIILAGTRRGTTTNEAGEFYLKDISEGKQTLEFSHIGYVVYKFTRQFYSGVELSANVELIPHHVRLEEVEVISEADSRHIRRRAAESNLITESQIKASGVATFSELIRNFVPRATVREDGPDVYISLIRATSLIRRYYGDSNPLIVIDGINYGTSPIGLQHIISVGQIEKLEVIRGPAALQYGVDGRHGVIIIDTKQTPPPEDGMPVGLKIFGGFMLGVLIFFLL